jgi:acetyl-CoA C-acetyltransferase
VHDGVPHAARRERFEDGPLEVKGCINFAAYGEFADHFQDQLLCEAKVHDYLGLDLLPNVGIKTGGATGGSAMLMGATTVASGMSDCTLVLGWERMDEVKTWTGNYYIASAACKDFETRLARNYASYYAPMARRFQEMYGVDERVRAQIAVKNRGYARSSPFSQQPGRHTVDEVLAGEVVSDPLRFLECCAMSVGSAAALLCSEELAFSSPTSPFASRLPAGRTRSEPATADRCASPCCRTKPKRGTCRSIREMEAHDGRWPGFESFGATRFAAYLAYGMAGVQNPIEDLDLVETHDAFTISDLQTYGDVGLTLYGHEQDYVTSGECYLTNPHSGKPGRCPANLSADCSARCTPWARRASSSAARCSGSCRGSTTGSMAIRRSGSASARRSPRTGRACRWRTRGAAWRSRTPAWAAT